MSIAASFRHLSLLLLVVEKLAATQRLRTLHFYGSSGAHVAQICVDGGMVVSGIRLAGEVYVDDDFKRDAGHIAGPLNKLLHGEVLNTDDVPRIQAASLLARRALGQLMARALRRIAGLADLTQIRIEDQPLPAPRPAGALRFAFPPVELLLAAGRSGRRRETDKATLLYDMPPEPVEERWLFEWQSVNESEAWPIMTSRQADKKANAVAQFGMLGQSLVQRVGLMRRGGDPIGVAAELAVTEFHVYYVIVTDRYVTLLVYQLQHIERVLRSMQDLVFDAPTLVRDARPPLANARVSGTPLAPPVPAPVPTPASATAPESRAEPPVALAAASQPAPEPHPAPSTSPASVFAFPESGARTLDREPAPTGLPPAALRPPEPMPIREHAAASVPEPLSDTIPISGPVVFAPRVMPELPQASKQPSLTALGRSDAALVETTGVEEPATATAAVDAAAALEAALPTAPSPSGPDWLLQLSGVGATVGGVPVLEHVDLKIGRCGLHALVGPSGAGKSSLLGLLSGKDRGDSGWTMTGEAIYDGAALGAGPRPAVLRAPFEHSTASLRAYLLNNLSRAVAERQTESSLLDLLDRTRLGPLGPYLGDPLGGRTLRLFASEWLRLALARELANNPALICLDDPTAGLSEAAQDVLWSVLRAESRHRAILVALRDAAEAELNGAEIHRLQPVLSAPKGGQAPLQYDAAPRVGLSLAPQTSAAYATPQAAEVGSQGIAPSMPAIPERGRTGTEPQVPAAPALPTLPPADPGAAVWATPIPMLRLRNFAVLVAGRSVLSNVNLDLPDCGLHLLVGPDDTRRRTFLRALCGPRSSQLELQGQFLFGGASLTKDRGLAIPSTDPRHALLTVREHLASRPVPWQASRPASSDVAERVEQAGFPELAGRLDVAFCELDMHERRVVEILALVATQPLAMVLHDVLHGVPAAIRPRLLALLARQASVHAILLCTDQPEPYCEFPFNPPLRVASFDDQGIREMSVSDWRPPGPAGAVGKPAR